MKDHTHIVIFNSSPITTRNPWLANLIRSYCGIRIHKARTHVGCGAGNTMRHISKRFGHVKIIGLDISTSALRYGSKEDEKSFFIRGDAEELPIRSDSIDCTVSLNLFEHLPNPVKAIREHYRVLKEGGIFHSLTPCEGEKLTIHGRSGKFRSLRRSILTTSNISQNDKFVVNWKK